MTMERFQGLVLKLGNQTFVRHYHWLNYPQDPQLMGVQFANSPVNERPSKPRSCDCGTCKKCRHREAVRNNRPIAADSFHRLFGELKEMGFERREDGIWTISRTEEPAS